MNSEIAKVCEFMVRAGSPPMQDLRHSSYPKNEVLIVIRWKLEAWAARLKEDAYNDVRLMRAWLMVEELGEVLDALFKQDDVELMDGLADLMYVVIGTAIQFDLPLAEAFDAVHESNMTKEPLVSMKTGYKDVPTYKPPNLVKILRKYRCKQ